MARCIPVDIQEKLCFLSSVLCIVISVYFFVKLPSMILYIFSTIFICSMIVRAINYWRSKYILFMLDMCYFINTLSIVMVCAFPKCISLQYVQFSLANSHAYWGSFLYRNALVLHDFQKLVSFFIHILPVVFSFLLRWYPAQTSICWYTSFAETGGKAELFAWMDDRNWIYQFLIPLLIFATREVLYYLIIYGCVKPNEDHLDTYRYMHKKKVLGQLIWNRFNDRWHLPIWILGTIGATAVILCVAITSWSSYLVHCILISLQLLVVCWNGACYYVDYQPVDAQRRTCVALKPNSFVPVLENDKGTDEEDNHSINQSGKLSVNLLLLNDQNPTDKSVDKPPEVFSDVANNP